MPPGPTNSIVDVANVAVGHATVWFDEPAPPGGRGVARTGVTAIVPFSPGELFGAPVPVGAAVLNGAGELTGFLQAQEWGSLETPILLTRTMGVGRVFDGVVDVMLAADPAVGAEDVVIPTVGECDDSWLSDGRVGAGRGGRRSAARSRRRAVRMVGPVVEGAVGAGTGMVCLGFKGGIGSASRDVSPTGYRVGALVLANFGDRAPRSPWTVCRSGGSSSPRVGSPRRDEPGGQLHRRARDGRSVVVASAATTRHARRARVWPAPVRSRTTAAARSSSRSAPGPGCRGRRTRTSSIAT